MLIVPRNKPRFFGSITTVVRVVVVVELLVVVYCFVESVS
jgi:hypothetical protein